jgi:energy-coupling factor transporter ATP-binding protein EcfA2
MITSASFRNFKSLRNVDIDLERLTVIVGPNASGKTSVLEGLTYLSLIYSNEPKELFVGKRRPGMLRTRGVNDEDMELQCRDTDAAIRLRVSFLSSEDLGQLSQFGDTSRYYETSPYLERGLPPRLEWRTLDQANGEWQELPKKHGLFFGPKQVQPIASQLSSAVLLRLDAAKLAEPSFSNLARPRVEYDGSGMASVLAFMALNQPETFESLQGHLKTLVPTLQRIRFDRVPVNRIETEVVTIDGESLTRHLNKQHIGDEVVLDFQGASDIPAHLASEGTILVLGLLAVLFSPANPQLLLLDDLEHGLHPKAQRKLIPLLRKVLEEKPDLQIIATAHSPYILNELDPKEVRITWASEDGVTQCARLESHPEFERWKDELWPGEFWSVVGEQWVGDGQGRESP